MILVFLWLLLVWSSLGASTLLQMLYYFVSPPAMSALLLLIPNSSAVINYPPNTHTLTTKYTESIAKPRKRLQLLSRGKKCLEGRITVVMYSKTPQDRSQPMAEKWVCCILVIHCICTHTTPKDNWLFIFPSFWMSLGLFFFLSNWELKVMV